MLVSIVPPRNDCGVRVLMHRHLVERYPFELHVVSSDADSDLGVDTRLRLPYVLHRLRKTRFGMRLAPWLRDYENLVWPLTIPRALDQAIVEFRPDVILTLAETSACRLAARAARKHGVPLASLFMDWFPIMEHHYGHARTQKSLSRLYRALYRQSHLALCISDGMKDVLGPHPNSHVIYPIPGKHSTSEIAYPPKTGKFRLVYVGAAESLYGRMLCALIEELEGLMDMEIIVVGPNADWPPEILQRARANGISLGFMPPEEAATVLVGADALLVVMSFEPKMRLFMETSFTTKFVDYTAFGKPIIFWGPKYCAPIRIVQRHGGALIVSKPGTAEVLAACRKVASDSALRKRLSQEAKYLYEKVFSPDRLQGIFVNEIESLANG